MAYRCRNYMHISIGCVTVLLILKEEKVCRTAFHKACKVCVAGELLLGTKVSCTEEITASSSLHRL